jgi:hypothetical protein
MTPAALSRALTELVAKECKCSAAWTQHAGEVTEHEMYKIRAGAEKLLREEHTEAVDRGIAARRRIERGILPDIGRDA